MPLTNLLQFSHREEPVRLSRSGFETIPSDLSKAELFRYFTYSADDRLAIFECRGNNNKVGFALLLGSVRLTGRFPIHFDLLPGSLLAHVCKQLKIAGLLFLDYPQRPATLHQHKERIKAYLGLRNFVQEEHQALIIDFVREQVRAGMTPDELTDHTEEQLRSLKFVLPGVTVLQRLISAALTQAEAELYQMLGRRLTEAEKAAILALLVIPAGLKITPFQQLQQTATRPSPEALTRELDHLEQVRALLPETLDLSDLPEPLVERWARLTGGLPTRSLQRYAEEKRLALLLCWLWRLRTQLIDTALTVGNELVAGVLRRAHHSYERVRQEQQKRVEQTLQLCGQVVGLVLDQNVADAQLRETLFQRFSRERLTILQNDCQELASPSQQLYLEELRKRYSYVRQFAPRLLETFALRAVIPNEPLLKAVNYLRERNQNGQRGLDENAPLDFVPAKWKPLVCPGGAIKGTVDRAVWEICLLSELSQALKSGNVHVPHSRAFQPVETYLIERAQWVAEKTQYAAQLPLDYEAHWPPLKALLSEQLRLLDEGYPNNPHLRLTDGELHLDRLEKGVTPESAQALKNRLRQMLDRRHLSDLLLEVQHWTNFLSGFTRLNSGRPITEEDTAEKVKLLTCLIAEGCNIGFSDMSIIGPGLSDEQLSEIQANYVRPETLRRATARLVNFHLLQWLPAAWGQGFTSSSDAALYQVPVRALNATFHPKYFASAGRGVAVYTHVSDLWIPFYTQVITCHVRQAPFILDGLLRHGTLLNPREHYTDTHGYTDLIFGITHLLGIRFAPRIKDLPDQRLWRLPDSAPYQHIEAAVSDKLNVNLIRDTWDEMLRLAASLKYGDEKASLIVSKLAAASHRNKLFRGLQELGRLVKTAYLAEYFREVELRRRVLLGLNKGESLHSLARKVFFGSLGEVRDRTYEDQLNAASSLNLLLAAIVCWNTVHLQACIKKLRADGVEVKEEDLRFLSPLLRHHIGIYGQYSFDFRRYEEIPSPEDLSY
jgi:TnpA family transposase